RSMHGGGLESRHPRGFFSRPGQADSAQSTDEFYRVDAASVDSPQNDVVSRDHTFEIAVSAQHRQAADVSVHHRSERLVDVVLLVTAADVAAHDLADTAVPHVATAVAHPPRQIPVGEAPR